jgi:hypothetical protein
MFRKYVFVVEDLIREGATVMESFVKVCRGQRVLEGATDDV